MLLDGLVAAAIPDPSLPVIPLPLSRVMGVFERLTGNPAWRHFEQFSNGAYEGRAEVELVVRSIAQLGNYDYLIDWIFTQSGVIRVEVGLTGIDAPKAVGPQAASAAATMPRFATPVAAELVAPFHSHHFNFRLDLDIDGQSNTFLLGKLEERPAPGPRRSIWTLGERAVTNESEGQLDEDHSQWKVVNGARRNALGEPVGYVVESHSHVEPLLHKSRLPARRLHRPHPFWVTAFDPDERYAAGDTPNQNPGTPGLPQYVRNNEGLVQRDLVLWLTIGHHHVTQAEDWPVLSRHRMSFELKPANFFDHNPAVDLRRAPFEARR